VPPTSLTGVQVDVTGRLGAGAPTTTTGLKQLDELLAGGLRTGSHVLISGAPGVGKTALALMLAYMAARARSAVLFASAALDDIVLI
jgi:KaiC/GvpD/RAD55 family RecA-like ATPase